MTDNGTTAPQRWEYNTVMIGPGNPVPALNKVGEDGWQVVCAIGMSTDGCIYLLQRQKSLILSPAEAMRRLRDGLSG